MAVLGEGGLRDSVPAAKRAYRYRIVMPILGLHHMLEIPLRTQSVVADLTLLFPSLPCCVS